MLRLTIGPMLMVHGYNKVFGKGGLEGTTRWFNSLGLHPAHVHARLAAGTEIGAGAMITLGAASPLPAAAAIGLMATAARTDHKGHGFFIFRNGWEYVGVVGAVAAVMAALGPGRFSIDHLIGRKRSGLGWALLAALFGITNAALLLATSYHPAPPAEPATAEPTPTGSEPTDRESSDGDSPGAASLESAPPEAAEPASPEPEASAPVDG
jgi:putative oxidoreductase